MVMKGYSTFLITRASPSDFLMSSPEHSLWGGVLPFCWDAVNVFYRTRPIGLTFKYLFMCDCESAHICVCVCEHIYLCEYYIRVCVCVCMYIYIYIHIIMCIFAYYMYAYIIYRYICVSCLCITYMCECMYLISVIVIYTFVVQSADTVENTNYISAESYPPTSVLDLTLNNLIARFQ